MLWDTGATISLITFKKARELQIKRGSKINLNVVKVGGQAEDVDSFLYLVPLTDENGKVIFIEAYGIERISSEMEYVEVGKVVCLFKGLKHTEVARPRG